MFDPKSRSCPRVIAHRGGGLLRPENSWEAFHFCAQAGFDYVETDAHLSKDGEVFLLHDPYLDRVSDARGPMSDHTSAQLEQIQLHGSQRGPVSLMEALQTFPNLAFNIDAKDDAVVEPLMATIQAAGASERVLIASFSASRLQRIRRTWPQLATSLGETEIATLVAASRLPHSWWTRLSWPWERVPPGATEVSQPAVPVAVQVPLSYRGIPVLTQRFVALSHRLGFHVHVWTLNEARQIRRALSLGADAIITDDPVMAVSVLTAVSAAH